MIKLPRGHERQKSGASSEHFPLHWIDVDFGNPDYQGLYANHRDLIDLAAQLLGYKGNERAQLGSTHGAYNVAYLTDVEGNWSYFLKWVDESPGLTLHGYQPDGSAELVLAPEWQVVFGGDVCDKGPEAGVGGSVRVTRSLLRLKRRYPERVLLILGNRDLNKLRFTSELDERAALGPGATITDLKSLPGPYWVPVAKRVTPVDYLRRLVAQQEKVAEDDVSDAQLLQANTKANRLRYILKETMGADGEFERRRLELHAIRQLRWSASDTVSDEDVVASFVESVKPPRTDEGESIKPPRTDEEPFMYEFIRLGQLAARIGDMLFVHGGLINPGDRGEPDVEVLGVVPDRKEPLEDVDEWIQALNEWKERQLHEYTQHPHGSTPPRSTADRQKTRGGDDLMDYVVATSRHPSVVMGRHLDSSSMAKQLPDKIVCALNEYGIRRVVVGHTPHGNCPTVVRSEVTADHPSSPGCVDLIMADTSYSDMSASDNRGQALSLVSLRADGTTTITGVLEDGKRKIDYELSEGRIGNNGDRIVGRLESTSASPGEDTERYFVKARLVNGDYLLCHVKGFHFKYKTLDRDSTAMVVGIDVANTDHGFPPLLECGQNQFSACGDELVHGQWSDVENARSNFIDHDLDEIFRRCDKNATGQIELDDFREAREIIKLFAQPECDIGSIETLFAAIDQDNSGSISLEELRRYLRTNGRHSRPACP